MFNYERTFRLNNSIITEDIIDNDFIYLKNIKNIDNRKYESKVYIICSINDSLTSTIISLATLSVVSHISISYDVEKLEKAVSLNYNQNDDNKIHLVVENFESFENLNTLKRYILFEFPCTYTEYVIIKNKINEAISLSYNIGYDINKIINMYINNRNTNTILRDFNKNEGRIDFDNICSSFVTNVLYMSSKRVSKYIDEKNINISTITPAGVIRNIPFFNYVGISNYREPFSSFKKRYNLK